jgi:hypothetical protein
MKTSASLDSPLPEEPAGATVVSYWHTHPQNEFSPPDITETATRYLTPMDRDGKRINLQAAYIAEPGRVIVECAPASVKEALEDLRSPKPARTSRVGVVPS